MNSFSLRRTSLAAAVIVVATLPAHAMLVLVSPQDFDGTGLGAVNTLLTLQSPGNATFEQ